MGREVACSSHLGNHSPLAVPSLHLRSSYSDRVNGTHPQSGSLEPKRSTPWFSQLSQNTWWRTLREGRVGLWLKKGHSPPWQGRHGGGDVGTLVTLHSQSGSRERTGAGSRLLNTNAFLPPGTHFLHWGSASSNRAISWGPQCSNTNIWGHLFKPQWRLSRVLFKPSGA